MSLSPWFSDQQIRWYRIAITTIGWFGLAVQFTINFIAGDYFGLFRFYTIQSNLIVLVWLTLALVWQDQDRYQQLTGWIKGAATTYITITIVVFHLLLSSLYSPTGWAGVANVITHYITPLVFIIDFLLTGHGSFQPVWSIQWLSYPLAYLAFVLVYGGLTGFYPYPFLNLTELGLGPFLIWVLILMATFVIVGLVWIMIKQWLHKSAAATD